MPKRRKNYGDDFYIKDNIVAYTGNWNDNPTVYFEKKHDNGDITYGHITQRHDLDKSNLGREKIETNKTYKLVNEVVGEDLRSKEYVNGESVHTSRNPNKKVLHNDEVIKDELAKAIDRYPAKKKMYAEDYVIEQIRFIQQEPLEKQPDQIVELWHELKGIGNQFEEYNLHDIKEYVDNVQTEVYEMHQQIEAQVNNQKSQQNQKFQNDNQKQIVKDQKEKPKLSAFSQAQNESKKLDSNQQEKMNNLQNNNNKKKEKKSKNMSMQ